MDTPVAKSRGSESTGAMNAAGTAATAVPAAMRYVSRWIWLSFATAASNSSCSSSTLSTTSGVVDGLGGRRLGLGVVGCGRHPLGGRPQRPLVDAGEERDALADRVDRGEVVRARR